MTGYSPRRRGSILSDMADIAQDLWASVPETVPAENRPRFGTNRPRPTHRKPRRIPRKSLIQHPKPPMRTKIAALYRTVESGG